MKRDLRINYANLKYIQRQLIQYVEEIRALSAAANVFLAVMQAQDSEAYKKLRKHWNDKVIDNASVLSGRLEQVAENLGGYISAMTTYIAPVDESREMRVDRNDIWFNYIQIGMNTRDYWDIFGDRGSSWDNYRRWFCYNPFESEEANNNRRNRMRSEDDAESSRRKGNYDKLQSFRDRMFRLLSVDAENHISKIRDIHQNNVIPYENMDDEYNKKLHSLYKEWATLGDVIRDNRNERLDFYHGAFKAVVDLVGGIAGLLWNLTEMPFYSMFHPLGLVPKWMQRDMDRLEQSVILLFTDPGQAMEAIGQNIFDTTDEEGVAFSAGYVIVDIAVDILVSKGLDKLKAAKMADDIVDVAGDVAKNADDVVDAARNLSKHTDDVVDTAENLVKHADEVADTAEDLAGHVDDLDGIPGKTEGVREQGIEGGSRTRFKYEHNPSDNPKVLRDAIEDPNAVYGYRPREDGSLAAFSKGKWDDPIAVEGYRQERIAYHNRNEGAAQQIVSDMTAEGASIEDIARTVNEYRNQSRINAYIDSNGNIKNIDGYKAALERAEINSYENLLQRGKTPEEIIKSATKGNPAMDACTGLYDEYFDTY